MKVSLDKKGSFTVFAMMLFMSLVFAVWIIINAAINVAINSSIDSLGQVWCKSILGEYDKELKNRYGILAFYDNEFSVEEKLQKYVSYSLDDKSYIYYKRLECSLEDFKLLNPDVLMEQIEVINMGGTRPKVSYYENDNEMELKSINNSWIIENLPSYNKTEKLYVVSLANKIKSGASIESLMENMAVDKYIFDFFKDYMDKRDLGKTYLEYEVEYIISGEYSDFKLKEATEDKIALLRNVLNLFYLYTCSEKRDMAMALATAVTPGATAFITQGIILETWAYAEANNDIKLLYDNKAVSLLKKDCNWALTLENVFNIEGEELVAKEESKEYVMPQKIEGALYKDYLKVLLCGIPEETKLLRIMDLIQINMKYTYCDYFLINDYNCGLSFTLDVNSKPHTFKDGYV